MSKRFGIFTTTLLLFVSIFLLNSTIASGKDSYNFGFKKSSEGKPASISQEGYLDILKKYDAIFLGDISKKELYLTFDNGYENGYTTKILDILKEKNVPATFFVT
ncbi:MAG: polysaccharide deacetylase family protein, partial [Vulcanibacillus sp.]